MLTKIITYLLITLSLTYLASASYDFVNMGTLGNRASIGWALNDNFQGVGYSFFDHIHGNGFIYDNGFVEFNYPGYAFSTFYDINNKGNAVGFTWNANPLDSAGVIFNQTDVIELPHINLVLLQDLIL